MNTDKKTNTDTVHYILTFISIVLLVVSFATHLITGGQALIQFDSLAGSVVLGSIFIIYFAWLVYEDHVTTRTSVKESIRLNIKKNTTFVFILLYWIVMVIIPFLCNLF